VIRAEVPEAGVARFLRVRARCDAVVAPVALCRCPRLGERGDFREAWDFFVSRISFRIFASNFVACVLVANPFLWRSALVTDQSATHSFPFLNIGKTSCLCRCGDTCVAPDYGGACLVGVASINTVL